MKTIASWTLAVSSYFTVERMIFTILGLGFVVYFPAFFNGFVMDDQGLILNNKTIQSFNIINFFRGSIFDFGGNLGGVYYRPVQSIFFSALYTLFGTHAFFYHFVQVILHTVNSVLVLLLFKKFFPEKLAFVCSLIFLVHPIHVDAVAYIASLQDVLFLFFGLLYILSLMRFYEPTSFAIVPYIFLLCGFLSKESGLLFLPLGISYMFLFHKKQLYFQSLLVVATLGLYCLLRVGVGGIGIHSTSEFAMMRLSFAERIIHIPAILWYYLKTFFFPLDLIAVQSWIISSINFEDFFLPLMLVGTVLFLLLYSSYRILHKETYPKLLFFWVWFIGGLLLHMQLTPLDVTVADRYFYFPMLGLLGILSLLFIHSPLTRGVKLYHTVVVISVFIIISLLAFRTSIRTFDWRDSRTLALHDLQTQPDNYQLLSSLGAMYLAEENYKQAIYYLEKSVRIYPYWGVSQYNLGVSYHLDKRADLAEKHYIQAIKNAPVYINAYENMAILLLKENPSKARDFTKENVKKFPGSLKMWQALALAEQQLGNVEAASEAAQMYYLLKTTPR